MSKHKYPSIFSPEMEAQKSMYKIKVFYIVIIVMLFQ